MRLVAIADEAMQFGTGATALRTILARALMPPTPKGGTPAPVDLSLISPRTVDDYMRRVREKWASDPLPDRDHARELTKRRHLGYLRVLRGDVVKNATAIAQMERNLARIAGTEAPRQIIASTPPGQPFEIRARQPEEMTAGERRRRMEELEREEAAAAAGAQDAVQAAVAAASASDDAGPS